MAVNESNKYENNFKLNLKEEAWLLEIDILYESSIYSLTVSNRKWGFSYLQHSGINHGLLQWNKNLWKVGTLAASVHPSRNFNSI